MSKVTGTGRVDDNGKMFLSNESIFKASLKTFAGKPIVITIEKQGRKRSLLQNNYYWGVVIPLVRDGLIHNGYNEVKTADDAHEVCRAMFLKKEIVSEDTGDIIISIRSSTSLSTTEAMGYYAAIQQWAAEFLNIQIPDPNEQLQIELNH